MSLTLRLRPVLPLLAASMLYAAAPGVHAQASKDKDPPASPDDEPSEGKKKKDDNKEPPPKKKQGPASKEDYALDTSASSTEIKVNGDGKLSIHIKPAPGMKVHPQAPLEVRLNASEGLRPARSKLGRKQVTDQESTAPELTCDLHAEAAGEHRIDAELTFYLCSETRCDRMRDKAVIAVKATP